MSVNRYDPNTGQLVRVSGKGVPGVNGSDGVGIASVSVNANNHLIVTKTDGTTQDAGEIDVTVPIDDENASPETVYSSEKVDELLTAKVNADDILRPSANMFDADNPNIVDGYYINANGGYSASDAYELIVIGIKPNTTYTFSEYYYSFATYDANDTPTSVVVNSGRRLVPTFISPNDSVVVKITIHKTNSDLTDYMFVEGDTLPMEFIPYTKYIDEELLDSQALNEMISGKFPLSIVASLVEDNEVEEITWVKGYYDALNGSVSNYDDGNQSYQRADKLIRIEPNVYYLYTGATFARAATVFYDAQKAFISSTYQAYFKTPNNAVYVGISNYKPTIPNADAHLKLACTLADIERTVLTSSIISCWGDSVTEGMSMPDAHKAVYGGSTYPSHLFTFLQDEGFRTFVNNYGIGGEKSTAVLARMGLGAYLTEDVVIDSENTPVDITSKIVSPYDNATVFFKQTYNTNSVMVDGVMCTIDVPVNTSTMTIKKTTADGVGVTLREGSLVLTVNQRNADINIVYAGINDGSSVTFAMWKARIEAILKNYPKTVIIGGTNSAFWTARGTTRETYLTDMRMMCGAKFLDLYPVLTTQRGIDMAIAGGYLSDRTAEQIAADDAAIVEGKVPPSLTVDGTAGNVHLNTAGYYVFAKLVYDLLKQLAWV